MEAIKAQGFKSEKRQVELVEPIKQLGVYTVAVKVWIVKED